MTLQNRSLNSAHRVWCPVQFRRRTGKLQFRYKNMYGNWSRWAWVPHTPRSKK